MREMGLMPLELVPCLAIVDRGLGGPGKIPQKVRPLTMIEESVMGVVLSSIMEDVKLCWSKLAKLEWSLEKMEMDIKSLLLVSFFFLMIPPPPAITLFIGNGTVIL